MVEIAATFGKHREDVAKGQSAYHRQGGPLTVEVVAGDVPVTGRQIAEFGAQVLGEVVADKGVDGGGVLVDILTEIIDVVGNGPASPSPYIPVVNRRRLGATRRQCQCNPHGFQSYVHRVSSSMLGVIGLPALCYV
ncbi:hypothetical protein D3C84_573000 [compost metagenome]